MRRFATAALLLCASLAEAADTGVSFDWKGGLISIEITVPLSASAAALPRAKAEAEASLDGRLAAVFADAVAPFPVDSLSTLGDLMASDRVLLSRLAALRASARKEDVRLSKDFSSLVARWTLPFFGERGLVAAFGPSEASPIRRRLGYVASRTYSGLLIIADASLPSVGKAVEEAPRPALFPRILDEDMKVVLERDLCGPEALIRWGMVGYADALDEGEILKRAGPLPLRTLARAVFGKNGSDLVIPNDAARQLLSREENIRLLREGRVIIVYGSLASERKQDAAAER